MRTPLHVLIVEDSEEDTLLLLRQLRHGGYDPAYERVDTAEAMGAALDQKKWDIVISDHAMPHFDAPAALDLVKKRGLDLPFILVSGVIGEEAAAKIMKSGAHDFISKDNLSRLIPAIERELNEVKEHRKRKRAEKKLQEALNTERDQLITIFDSIDEVIYVSDPGTFELVYANAAAKAIFGQDIVGKKCYRVFQRLDKPCDFCTNPIIFGNSMGTPYIWEFQNKVNRRWYRCIDKAIRWPDGRMMRFEVAIDIHDHKCAAEALGREKEKFRVLVEESPFGIACIRKDGQYTYINPKFIEIFGYTLKDIPAGRDWFERAYPDAKYRDQVVSIWEKDLKESKIGESRPRAFDVRCKDGSEKVINFRPVTMETGDQLVIYEDVTEKRRLQDQLRQAQKMEAIGTLAGGIAHDFNNILGIILGCTELSLLSVPDFFPAHRHLMEVLKATNRAKDLVQQILTFSRKSEQERTPVEPGIIFKEALKMLRSSLPSTIQIRQYIRKDAGIVFADPTQLHQVLMNLCANAAHAMQEKGGIMKVALSSADIDAERPEQHPDLPPGAYIDLTVSDTGHGMDRSVMERIFDPYFTTKGKGEGTGLGLAVTHGIVRSHGGAIRVHSEPEKGSTFQVFLPRSEDLKSPAEANQIEELPLGNERILVVDDEKALVNAKREMLKRLGYGVVTRTSSIEALRTFRAQADKFDLVITDMTMPDMTGVQLAKELMHIKPGIPIILCTGFSEMITPEDARAMGIREFLMKPIGMKEMAKIVRKVLGD